MTDHCESEILASLGRLHKRLDEMNADIADVKGQLQKQLGVCHGAQQTLQRCFNDLHGNGREGVIATQARHAEMIRKVGDRVEKLGVPAKSVRTSKRTSIVSVIAAVGSAIAAALAAVSGR